MQINRFELGLLRSPQAPSRSEVRIMIDNQDWLGERVGLTPEELLTELRSCTFTVFGWTYYAKRRARLLVGLCECGCPGCGDVQVSMRRDKDLISWTDDEGRHLAFDRRQYDAEVARFGSARPWNDEGVDS